MPKFMSNKQRKFVMMKLNKGDFVKTRERGIIGIFKGFKKGRYEVDGVVNNRMRKVRVTDKPKKIMDDGVPKKFPSGKPIPSDLRIKLLKETIKIRESRR